MPVFCCGFRLIDLVGIRVYTEPASLRQFRLGVPPLPDLGWGVKRYFPLYRTVAQVFELNGGICDRMAALYWFVRFGALIDSGAFSLTARADILYASGKVRAC